LTFNRYLCEICSMCENMANCVKIQTSLDTCVKYAQSVKIWPSDVLILFSDALCAVSESLCSNSDRHYTESGNYLAPDEEKGRHALWGRVSNLNEIETLVMGAHLQSQKKRDTHYGSVSPFYLTPKNDCQQNILHEMLLAPASYSALWCKYVTYLRGRVSFLLYMHEKDI
jgi:hypothetical protein